MLDSLSSSMSSIQKTLEAAVGVLDVVGLNPHTTVAARYLEASAALIDMGRKALAIADSFEKAKIPPTYPVGNSTQP